MDTNDVYNNAMNGDLMCSHCRQLKDVNMFMSNKTHGKKTKMCYVCRNTHARNMKTYNEKRRIKPENIIINMEPNMATSDTICKVPSTTYLTNTLDNHVICETIQSTHK